MDLTTILISVGASVLFLVVVVIVCVSVSNKKKEGKLDKAIEEYRNESKKAEEPSPIQIADEEPILNNNEFENSKGLIIEDYTDSDFLGLDENIQPLEENVNHKEKFEDDLSQESSKEKNDDSDDINWEDFTFLDDDEDKKPSKKHSKTRKQPKDDFEDFLDNYSYTRKIIDKNLLKKLNSLPPEVKDIILGNVFNKYE